MKRLGAFLLLSIIIFRFKEGISQSKRLCKRGYPANAKILVIISFDGFRGDYNNFTNMPYMNKLANLGAVATFETLRYANALNVHHTIATGDFPGRHGVFAHEWFEDKFPNTPRKYQKYQREQYENNIARDNRVLPIWTLNDLNGGTSACMMWPGCEFNYGPANSNPTYIQEYSAGQTYESRLQQIITWMNETETFNPPNLVMIYFNQIDHLAHVYGPNSPKIIPVLQELDEFTKNLTNKLKQLPFTILNKKLYPSVNIVFVSDHRLTEIMYQDILDIPAQGECSDAKFYGSDVWLQQAFTSRENMTTMPFRKVSGSWTCNCSSTICFYRGIYDTYTNYLNSVFKYVWGVPDYSGCWSNTYNLSLCVAPMIHYRLPPRYAFFKPQTTTQYRAFPRTIANFTIFVADVNHTWSLNMDEAQKLVFAAYGEKLYPKIDAWRKKYNFAVNECTKFGVHGYYPRELGYFIAIGPAFVKRFKYRRFNVMDLYSLFAKVLGFRGTYNRDGNFRNVRPFLISSYDEKGTGLVNWIQHLKLIVICSIIHCAVFFIAVEIYLARHR